VTQVVRFSKATVYRIRQGDASLEVRDEDVGLTRLIAWALTSGGGCLSSYVSCDECSHRVAKATRCGALDWVSALKGWANLMLTLRVTGFT